MLQCLSDFVGHEILVFVSHSLVSYGMFDPCGNFVLVKIEYFENLYIASKDAVYEFSA